MLFDERKKKILKAIIDDYIDTAEPIGSRSIARKHQLGLSSATIRNEMSDLEEMGYLTQPHTSAGRIPSDKGYRLYVDELMKDYKLTKAEIDHIKSSMEVRINELSQLMRHASAIMSRITRYTSLAMTPKLKETIIKAVQVVPIDSKKVLTIVVINGGIVRNCITQLPKSISPDNLIKLSNMINEKLNGQKAGKISIPLVMEMERIMGEDAAIIRPIIDAVEVCIEQTEDGEVYLDGTTNIFNYPEFSDVLKAKEFLSILDGKELVGRLLRKCIEDGDLTVKIGSENEIEQIKDYSLVAATYNLNDSLLGAIGVIGPTRMDYSRVVSSLNYIRELLNRDLKKMLGEDSYE